MIAGVGVATVDWSSLDSCLGPWMVEGLALVLTASCLLFLCLA